LVYYLLLYYDVLHHVLRSFPTRRSSDLHAARLRSFDDERTAGCRARRASGVFVRTRSAAPLSDFISNEGVDDDEPRSSSDRRAEDRKSTRLNSSHRTISYAVFCLKKKKK